MLKSLRGNITNHLLRDLRSPDVLCTPVNDALNQPYQQQLWALPVRCSIWYGQHLLRLSANTGHSKLPRCYVEILPISSAGAPTLGLVAISENTIGVHQGAWVSSKFPTNIPVFLKESVPHFPKLVSSPASIFRLISPRLQIRRPTLLGLANNAIVFSLSSRATRDSIRERAEALTVDEVNEYED